MYICRGKVGMDFPVMCKVWTGTIDKVIFYWIINTESVLSLVLYKHCLIGAVCAWYRSYKNITVTWILFTFMTDSDFWKCFFFGMKWDLNVWWCILWRNRLPPFHWRSIFLLWRWRQHNVGSYLLNYMLSCLRRL